MSSSDYRISKFAYTSRAWRFFIIKDRDLKIAKCKICQNLLSYRTSVTNLLKHVRNRHQKAYREHGTDKSENCEASAFSLSENEDDDRNDDDSEDNKPAKILESPETKNEEESVCLLCQETFPDQDSAKMMKHMVKVHNISQIKLVDGNIHLEQEEKDIVENTVHNSRSDRRSTCWDYFSISNNADKIAVCNLCDRELSFKSTVSNLLKHLNRKHKIVPKRGQDGCVNDSSEKTYKASSAVWSFFNYVNDEKTVCACVRCNKEFNIVDGINQMKKHLVDQHPEALLHHKTGNDPLFITTKNEDNNEESEEDEDLHEEYLDFDDLDMPDKVKSKPSFERKQNLQRCSSERKPKLSPSYGNPALTENKVPVVTKTKVPDSLEHFANYITSLLQELPEKISKKLQMNFVKQIIEAQISYVEMENKKEETVTRTNSTVNGTVLNSGALVAVDKSVCIDKSNTVSEGIITTANVNSDGTLTVGNGIIIRPIVTTS